MKPIKRLLNQFFSIFGYKFIRAGSGLQGPIINNYIETIRAYEHLFSRFRGDELIKNNEKRHEIIARMLGTPPSEVFFIVEAIAKTNRIEGDVCEFGVAQGETSALIANEIRCSEKKLHLFDSFEGLPQPSQNDVLKEDIFNLGSMEAYEGQMSCPEHMVIQRMKDISFDPDRYRIHKGYVDQTLKTGKNLPEKVCFAYLDFDFYESTRLVLDYLDDKTPAGSILIIDDYDFFSTGIKQAVDEFVEEKNMTDAVYHMEVPSKIFGNFAILKKNHSKMIK